MIFYQTNDIQELKKILAELKRLKPELERRVRAAHTDWIQALRDSQSKHKTSQFFTGGSTLTGKYQKYQLNQQSKSSSHISDQKYMAYQLMKRTLSEIDNEERLTQSKIDRLAQQQDVQLSQLEQEVRSYIHYLYSWAEAAVNILLVCDSDRAQLINQIQTVAALKRDILYPDQASYIREARIPGTLAYEYHHFVLDNQVVRSKQNEFINQALGNYQVKQILLSFAQAKSIDGDGMLTLYSTLSEHKSQAAIQQDAELFKVCAQEFKQLFEKAKDLYQNHLMDNSYIQQTEFQKFTL